MPRRASQPVLAWASETDLVGITLTLQPQADFQVPAHYATELHSWFLNQVRLDAPDLSAYLHDGQSEKAFTVSALTGQITTKGRMLQFAANQTYEWQITALSQQVCCWMRQWLHSPPKEMKLRSGSFNIQGWQVSLPATTYEAIWTNAETSSAQQQQAGDLSLTFTTSTSFRKRGNHMPLPIPENVFHSYLRRWNIFAHLEFEQDHFLDWVNECVVILRHEIRSQKVQAGKQGSVTGFTGAIQFGLTPKAKSEPEYVQLVHALIACAPYFGTGHKVTFGLGQTQCGWLIDRALTPTEAMPTETVSQTQTLSDRKADLIAARQAELKAFFFSRKKRQGGERAEKAADLWAAILAHQEFGESLKDIAIELELPYETVKRYAKRARHTLEER